MTSYSVENILDAVDIYLEYDYQLSNANYDVASARLTGFKSDNGWAIFLEKLVSWPAADGIMLLTYAAGSILDGYIGSYAPSIEINFSEYEIDDDGRLIPPEDIDICIRNMTLQIKSSDVSILASKELDYNLLLYLLPDNREFMLHTDAELQLYLKGTTKQKLIQLDNWYHDGDWNLKPSETEVYQLLAEVLVTGDRKAYKPTESPNTNSWLNFLRF